MYTLEKIKALRARTINERLDDREILDQYSDEELQRICNGIGPDRFPWWLRWLVTQMHPTLESVAMIHDIQWYERELRGAPESETLDREDFYASNDMFRKNGYKAADYNYCDNKIMCYKVRWDAWKFSKLCGTSYGFESWQTS